MVYYAGMDGVDMTRKVWDFCVVVSLRMTESYLKVKRTFGWNFFLCVLLSDLVNVVIVKSPIFHWPRKNLGHHLYHSFIYYRNKREISIVLACVGGKLREGRYAG